MVIAGLYTADVGLVANDFEDDEMAVAGTIKDDNQASGRQHKIERNEIAECRAELLRFLMSPESSFLVRQRDVIKALLPEIKAAREMGVGFERVAELLNGKGIRLKADTIREYYFEEIRQQDQEAIHETALRYKRAAEEAIQRFQTASGRGLDEIVKKAVDDAAAKKKPAAAPVPVTPTPAAPVVAVKATSQSDGGKKTESASVPKNDAARAASPPAVSEKRNVSLSPARVVSAVSEEQLEKLLNKHFDPRDIPRRPLPDEFDDGN